MDAIVLKSSVAAAATAMSAYAVFYFVVSPMVSSHWIFNFYAFSFVLGFVAVYVFKESGGVMSSKKFASIVIISSLLYTAATTLVIGLDSAPALLTSYPIGAFIGAATADVIYNRKEED